MYHLKNFFWETDHFGLWSHFPEIVKSGITFLLWLGSIPWITLRMEIRFSVGLYAVA